MIGEETESEKSKMVGYYEVTEFLGGSWRELSDFTLVSHTQESLPCRHCTEAESDPDYFAVSFCD